ncbi:MAG: cysteine--tRNA ligase [Dehalococcoidia bacterium]|nr:cysteine--tRNA ligase [Dehalococcoidia bacterium]
MKIFNTLSGQKEEFIPHDNEVKMYVCGVTVYDLCHFGHALCYVSFDVIRRYLEYKGYNVKYVQNFTDIDDKIINRSNERGIPWMELVEKYIAEYFIDMDALNVKRATIYPRATEEIPMIIDVVKTLVEKGHAYISEGSVYFSVKSYPAYGKLTHQNADDMRVTSTIESEKKEDPLDFALWKAVKPGEPAWPSPWGEGRPGWHIECTAMSIRHLGKTLDIHGGGQDLVFPHHENEIAQSECYTGTEPFVRIWMHNGFLQLGADKMSKSLGNLVTVKQALERNSADAIRLFIISSYYRMPLRYSMDALDAAEAGIERMRQALKAVGKAGGDSLDPALFKARFIEAMDDDFNAPQAVAVIFDLVREINRGAEKEMDISGAQAMLKELAGVIGFSLQEAEVDSDKAAVIEEKIRQRNEFRKAKEWKKADEIRDELLESGVAIEDGPRGTTWKVVK